MQQRCCPRYAPHNILHTGENPEDAHHAYFQPVRILTHDSVSETAHVETPDSEAETAGTALAHRLDPRSLHGFAPGLRIPPETRGARAGMDIVISDNLVAELMRIAGIVGLPGPVKVKRLKVIATADDLVHRKFHRLSPNKLWINDTAKCPTCATEKRLVRAGLMFFA